MANPDATTRAEAAFAALKSSPGIVNPYRVAVVQFDGGAFHKDFPTEADALRMYNANVEHGRSLLVTLHAHSPEFGWQVVTGQFNQPAAIAA